jgi:anti-anti-sigma regulatory factor
MYFKLPPAESNTSGLVSAVDESAQKGDQTLTVGLDEIADLDAAMMNALITALRRMRDAGGTVELHVTRPDLLVTLGETGLDKVFKVVANADEPRPKVARKRKRRSSGVRSIAGGLAGAIVALLVLGAR